MKMSVEADRLFEEAVNWLQQHYSFWQFFTERDIEWTLQLHLLREIEEKRLGQDLAVFQNHKMRDGQKKVDLAIVERRTGFVLCAAELKYEPDHARGEVDIPRKKLDPSVVFWDNGVVQDIEKMKTFVADDYCQVGHVLFIDEGAHHRCRKGPKESEWFNWGGSRYSENTIAALRFKAGRE